MSAADDAVTGDATQQPFLRVVAGNPTDEEVAALVAVLSSAGAPRDTGPAPRNDWGRPTDMHRPAWGMPSSFTNRG